MTSSSDGDDSNSNDLSDSDVSNKILMLPS